MGERPDLKQKSEMHEISRKITARVHPSISPFSVQWHLGVIKQRAGGEKKLFFAGKRLRDLEKEMRRVKEGRERKKEEDRMRCGDAGATTPQGGSILAAKTPGMAFAYARVQSGFSS